MWIQEGWDVTEKLQAPGSSSQSDLFPGFPGGHDGKMWGNPLLNLLLNPALAFSRGISTQSHPRAGCGKPDPALCSSCLSLSRLGIGFWSLPVPKKTLENQYWQPRTHSLARKALPNPWMLRAFPKEAPSARSGAERAQFLVWFPQAGLEEPSGSRRERSWDVPLDSQKMEVSSSFTLETAWNLTQLL